MQGHCKKPAIKQLLNNLWINVHKIFKANQSPKILITKKKYARINNRHS